MNKTKSAIHPPSGLKFLLFAIFLALIGSLTVAHGQQFSTSFETDAPNFGDFTLFPSPNSVTFTGGFTQTQGNSSLYHSGDKSFMVNSGNTGTITFQTPAASVTLWYRDQSNQSVLTVFDQNNQVISTTNGTTTFVRVNIVPGCGQLVGSMTLQNSGAGMAVIDDFSFTAGQVGASTVLIANFMNGNDTVFNSRVYLWNPSANAGEVCVRVFTLPRQGGTAQELTTAPLSLGTLLARSALNVKVAEDILDPLGRRPYTDDDGDLTLEFTIHAAGVKGAAQVFSSSFASGTNPLQEVPSTPGASPTVLVANFMNGNDASLNSRVYLWNPSTSAGTVTVRVFTLPLGSSNPLELTGAPLDLGLLGSRSAMNVNVANDILTPAGITTPHITDGGNLTLEFTIQAADVVGAAQVFSSSFGFGVYPLQRIPSTPGASPTVLVANFMNGNSDAFSARVYLWNPSASAGDLTVRVFSLPLKDGAAQELTGGALNLGRLGAKSALNVKVVEDILNNVGITTPYITDGGNLTLEFTIQAPDVVGAAQVFSSSFAFGTNPLQEVPSTPGASPTVLVANFMNGNSDALNSRVYLWNPSASAGDVTVRVFSLPLSSSSGTAQELTTTPRNLGSLGGRSALNIKLVEDILIPLGIATPYTIDGGNLTLEFTIQAADVVGAAQVFSSSFAFGTYPMQDPPGVGVSEGSSTPGPGPGLDPGADPGPDPFDEDGY